VTIKKYEFPSNGFDIVLAKVGEENYFLDKLGEFQERSDEFSSVLSAFSAAARSVNFSLQNVMSKYPDFDEWYKPHRNNLKSNKLAKCFVGLRNHMQKVGDVPVGHTGTMRGGEINHVSFFIDSENLTKNLFARLHNWLKSIL